MSTYDFQLGSQSRYHTPAICCATLVQYGNHCYNAEYQSQTRVPPCPRLAIQLCTVPLLVFSDMEPFYVCTRVSWGQTIALCVYAVYSLVGNGQPMCLFSAFLTACQSG
jgi:hypothetical protein